MHLDLHLVIGLLVAATAVAIGAKRARVPYNVALVVGGMLLAVAGVLTEVPPLRPDVVFLVCLPVLLFEGGIAADLPGIRANAVPIVTMSTFGMLLAIGATGTALRFGLAIPWGPAFLLGAILAVTDTVSVLFAFRRASVPARLSGIMQGESLFNDGTALVVYAAIASVVVGGGAAHVPTLAAKVILTSIGGLGIGLALGLLGGFVLRWTQDALTEIMATTALAYASYSLAEQFHMSGVIAAVTCGLAVGTSLRRYATPSSQMAIHTFWEYVAFGVNTFLFLSVGLATSPSILYRNLPLTLTAIVCVVIGRSVAVYLPFAILRVVRPVDAVPLRWQHVFVAGNIKGALSIALALGLPEATPFRDQLLAVAFGVTFLSLVGQGLLLPRFLEWMGLLSSDPNAESLAEQQARLIAARGARQELETMHAAGLVPRADYDLLRSEYQMRIAGAERELRRLQERHLAVGARSLLAARRRLADAERTALLGAQRGGLVPERVADTVAEEIEERLLHLEHAMSGRQEEKP